MIGERLAELRKDKGWTQKELGVKLSLAEKTIFSYENNINTPSDETKITLAKIFNVSLDYLLGLIDEEVSYDRTKYVLLPNNFTSSDKEEIKDYINYLKSKK